MTRLLLLAAAAGCALGLALLTRTCGEWSFDRTAAVAALYVAGGLCAAVAGGSSGESGSLIGGLGVAVLWMLGLPVVLFVSWAVLCGFES